MRRQAKSRKAWERRTAPKLCHHQATGKLRAILLSAQAQACRREPCSIARSKLRLPSRPAEDGGAGYAGQEGQTAPKTGPMGRTVPLEPANLRSKDSFMHPKGTPRF